MLLWPWMLRLMVLKEGKIHWYLRLWSLNPKACQIPAHVWQLYITSFKFTVLPALNPSYSATTAILASTLATSARPVQSWRPKKRSSTFILLSHSAICDAFFTAQTQLLNENYIIHITFFFLLQYKNEWISKVVHILYSSLASEKMSF